MSSTRGIVASRPARGGPAPPCSRVEILHTANPTATSATARHLHGGKEGEGGSPLQARGSARSVVRPLAAPPERRTRPRRLTHSLARPAHHGIHRPDEGLLRPSRALQQQSASRSRAVRVPSAEQSVRCRRRVRPTRTALARAGADAMAWTQFTTKDPHRPGARECHSMVAVGSTLYAFGGNDKTRRFNDLHALDSGQFRPCRSSSSPGPSVRACSREPPSAFWPEVPPAPRPPPRARQGGLGSLSRGAGPAGTGLMTGPMVSCVDKCPRSCPPACAAPAPGPPPRRWTSALWRESTRGCPCLARLRAPAAPLFAESYCWATITPAAGSEIPCMRTAHAATTYAHFMIIFGGWNGERELDDVFSFDTGEARGGSRHATLSGFVRSDQHALHSFCSFSAPCVFPARRGPALAGAQGVRPWTQRAAFPGAGGCSQAAHGVWRLQRHTLVQRRARDEPR